MKWPHGSFTSTSFRQVDDKCLRSSEWHRLKANTEMKSARTHATTNFAEACTVRFGFSSIAYWNWSRSSPWTSVPTGKLCVAGNWASSIAHTMIKVLPTPNTSNVLRMPHTPQLRIWTHNSLSNVNCQKVNFLMNEEHYLLDCVQLGQLTCISDPMLSVSAKPSRTFPHMSLLLHALSDWALPRIYMPSFAQRQQHIRSVLHAQESNSSVLFIPGQWQNDDSSLFPPVGAIGRGD